MKITPTILSIPPYLSTTWSNIAALRIDDSSLIVTLQTGAEIEVPNLEPDRMEAIFEAHARYGTLATPAPLLRLDNTLPLQHNPEQADLPPLPPEMLDKISEIVKTLGISEQENLPKAEPDCNCPYCQLARAITPEEEIVDESDLHFRDWEVAQQADKLYLITNPLDANEHYNVFLGDPLGCTCGQKNCEHIRAALNT